MCTASPALAKDHRGSSTAPGQEKKTQRQAAAEEPKEVTNDQRQEATGERQAAKDERQTANGERQAARPQHETANGERQAAKQQREAAKDERQAARQQRQVARQQRHAGNQQRAVAKQQRHAAERGAAPVPLNSSGGNGRSAAGVTPAAANPVRTTAAPRGRALGNRRAAARRAAARRAAARRAAARRAARRAAARRRAAIDRRGLARRRAARSVPVAAVAATTPVAAATPVAAGPIPKPAATKQAAKRTRAPAAKPKQGPVRVVTRTVTRTVRDIAQVVPTWAKVLLGLLAALLALAAVIAVLAALRNRRLRALSRKLLDEVGVLSTALLPAVPDKVGMLGVSVAYRPAEGLAAGGDFYDVFPLDRGRVGIVVGDVSGHGKESLGPATFIRHMVRSYLEAGLVPRAALQLAGRVVDDHDRDDFATVVAAVHDPSAGTLSYATAGHPSPIVIGPGEHRPLTVASAPPLGVGDLTGVRQTTVPVAPGTTICFFTDGLIEARKDGKVFGRPRVERIIRDDPRGLSAERLVAAVGREAEALPDDIAVCVLHVEGGAQTASTLRVEEIEVTKDELNGDRLREFLEACGIAPTDVGGVVRAAHPRAVKFGSIVLRVRLAEDRSGVDILPVESTAPGAELSALRRTS